MKSSEVLDNAANIILRDGWYRGAYYQEPARGAYMPDADVAEHEQANKTGPCCQAGAISRAITGWAWLPHYAKVSSSDEQREWNVAVREATQDMTEHIHSLTGGRYTSPIVWNDEGERTAEEVVAALRGAAEYARTQGR